MIEKGKMISDRYEILKSIGEGGMANVYVGYDTILNRKVAIKILRGDLANDEKFVRRFQREALSASSLSHPNIVEMYDVGEDDGMYYIIMEYIEGKTLKQLIKKRGSITLSEAIDIMLQLTDGITQAHDSYIIHRDLKPQNIMIEDDGQIKITDFGIAMALNSTQLTQTNSVMGSVHYLPPEQASGKGSTIKSDIYSMGIIFYELLSGSLPFRGDNAVEIALKHMKEPLPTLMREDSSIPQSIQNIILKSTAKNPKNRYANARDMHQDLLTALDDDRINEEPYLYKYPEHDQDASTKSLKKLEDKQEELEDIEEDKNAKKRKILIIVLASIFGLIAISLISIFLIIPKLTEKKSIRIPDVSDMSVSKAEKKLQDQGFKVAASIKTVNSDKIKEGKIVKTNPAAGRYVKEGTVITLYKSKGEKTYTIEDYTGKNYIEIQTELEKVYHLEVTVEKKAVEDGTKYDDDQLIIGQSLARGSKVKKGDSIILYIPDIVDSYPDMLKEGWNLDDVEAFCSKYGITLQTNFQETSSYEEGKVISQSRSAGSPIVKGTTLSVTIAKKQVVKPTVPSTDKNNPGNKDEKPGSSTTEGGSSSGGSSTTTPGGASSSGEH